MPEKIQRWFPSKDQIKPEKLERTIRQVLTQHYALQDQLDATRERAAKPQSQLSGPPPGSGPTDTQLLGLRVAPIDSQTLADGATLKWDKKSGTFIFS